MTNSAPLHVRPASVWGIYLILVLQGSAVVLTSVLGALTAEEQVLSTPALIAMVGLFVFSGLVLILVGFRIFRGTPGARTPILVFEILFLVLSMNFLLSAVWGLGLLLALPACAVLVLLFLPATQQWLYPPQA